MKKVLSAFLSLVMLLSITAGIDMSAIAEDLSDTYTIRVPGDLNYDKAFEALEVLNEERAAEGIAPLAMDQELLDAAMIRATEASLYFSHDRPDGSDCFDLCDKMYGENILIGTTTAQGAIKSWMDSEGHKANMMSKGYKSVGIGVFSNDGTEYWVQCFGIDEAEGSPKSLGVESIIASVEMQKSITVIGSQPFILGENYFNGDGSMYLGQQAYLSYGIVNQGWPWRKTTQVNDDYTFTSSDTSVLEIDSEGIITTLKKGVATVTVTNKQYPELQSSFEITVIQPLRAEKVTDTSAVIVRDEIEGADSYQFELYKEGSWWVQLESSPRTVYTDLEPGTEYQVRVLVKKNGQMVVWNETITICTKPGKVTGLHTAARGGTGERLRIEWDARPEADGYNVYMKKDGKYVYVASTQKTEYVFEDLVPGWEYYFKVTAYMGETSNAGYGSDELHTCAACPPMDAPSVNALDSKTIQVDWNITNAHGYVVQWSTDPNFKTGLNSAYVVGHTSDSYTISVPGNSQNYYVRTRAWRYWENNSLVYGIWTNGVKHGQAPARVTGLYTSARGGYGEQLKISWDAQSMADSYNVYRLTDGEYKLVATTTDTSYVFRDVVPGWEYYFKVSAVKNGREGMLSKELHTCAACPPIETCSAAINKNGSVTVDWEMVNAHGYVVMWSTDPEFKTDVNYSYVVGHESTSYTFTPSGNAEDYYVRIRAWRYWENNSLVYGIWTDGIELA